MSKYPILEMFVAWVSANPGLERPAVKDFESVIQKREHSRDTNGEGFRPVVLSTGFSLESLGEI